MQNKKIVIKNFIDTSLTPETADEKGYMYIEDVFNPYTAIEDIKAFAQARGYKFGRPSDIDEPEGLLGLYLCMNKPKEK